jgi:hypothetical protein
MRTFEERYTAWIDGELEGNALVAFEQELERRASVSDAYADKADAMRLNAFLHDHLQAPVLTNADFFNHQLRERIAGERAASQRHEEKRAPVARVPLFAWSLSRLAWMGAACLFISGALYYGMIPQQGSGSAGASQIAGNQPKAQIGTPGVGAVQNGNGADSANAVAQRTSGNGPTEVASLTKDQQERIERERDLAAEQAKQQRIRATIEPGSDINARVPDQTVPATATPLHYRDANVNVLWVNGLDYLPDAASLDNNASPPAPVDPAAATATP